MFKMSAHSICELNGIINVWDLRCTYMNLISVGLASLVFSCCLM
jgi:hypothetical protein